jgi:aminoglycoside phosphotransferase (APT) family kinase protein
VLDQQEVAPYLLHCGLVSTQSVAESDLLVLDASRRNSNFKVVCRHGPSYLLKQGADVEKRATIAREVAVYRFLQAVDGNAAFKPYLPHLYKYDRERCLLILELYQDAETATEYHLRLGRFPASLGAAMGRALGTLHGPDTLRGLSGNPHSALSERMPWVLSIHRPSLSLYHEASSAGLHLMTIIQSFPQFGAQLDILRAEWGAGALIHGDIKWENWLVTPRTGASWRTRLKLVDWELAGLGDPCWDVGCVFADYINFWVLSILITGNESLQKSLGLARYPIACMQPAMRLFWDSYAQHMRLDTATAGQWLLRAVRYAAARLLHLAFEQMQSAMQITSTAICLLQISLNILQRPDDAATGLLGIPRYEEI